MASRPKDSSPVEDKRPGSVRVQATVSGFTKWALEKLVSAKGQSIAEVGGYALERWVDDNLEFLSRFGITLSAYETELEGKVTPFRTGE